MKFSSLTSITTALAAMTLVACSQTSDKGAIPPDHPVQKVRDSDEHAVFNQMVDILFVVDDSGSMENHQANLSTNIHLFTQELAKTQFLDYHVGVVTTSMDHSDPNIPWDPTEPWGSAPCSNAQVQPSRQRACGDGRLVGYKTQVPFIDRNTPNGLQVLETNLIVGTNGSAEEMMFDPIRAALTPPMENGPNQGFLRPDASLAVIFVSDAEDQSHNLTSGKALYDFLLQIKGGRTDRLMGYAALVPTSETDPSCSRDEGSVTPLRVEAFLNLVKGLEYNICDADYGTKLGAIAKDVVAKVGKIMYLSRIPDPKTITVSYGTQSIPNDPESGWTYDPVRNALIFGDKLKYSVQPQGTQMTVDFTAGEYTTIK